MLYIAVNYYKNYFSLSNRQSYLQLPYCHYQTSRFSQPHMLHPGTAKERKRLRMSW